MIKSRGVSLIASDRSGLAVKDGKDFFGLYVKSGKVNFTLLDLTRKIAFYTPDGVYSVAGVMLNADANSAVRGYMKVDRAASEVGVTEGKMIFATSEAVTSSSSLKPAIALLTEL